MNQRLAMWMNANWSLIRLFKQDNKQFLKVVVDGGALLGRQGLVLFGLAQHHLKRRQLRVELQTELRMRSIRLCQSA